MRLIIKDYLLQLKEKDELDLLLCDLIFQMGYVTDNRPETGNRQYGVDIRAHNEDSVFLFVVKQGNMNRRNWDTDPNSVRQSLNEVFDCYLNLFPLNENQKKLHIIVATNGMMDEAVAPNWEGYIRQHTAWNGVPVLFCFWNIDVITDHIQRLLFDERIFNTDMRRLLRRALYYIGEPDYPQKYYEQIIDDYLNSIKLDASAKEQKKNLSGMFLASQMIAYYAADEHFYSIAIHVSEYLIIRYWQFLLTNKLFEKEFYVDWLNHFLSMYEKWNKKYYFEVKSCCETKSCMPPYNSVEKRVKIYEILAHLITFAYYLSCKKYDIDHLRGRIYNTIIKLINNYPQAYYPPYDEDIGIISMLFRFLNKTGNHTETEILMRNICTHQVLYYRMFHKYPSPIDSFKDAVDIDMGTSPSDYNSTAFWGVMLEWVVLMDARDIYDKILYQFLSDDIKDVTKCTWYLRSNEENYLYEKNTMFNAGDGVSIETPEKYEDLEKEIECLQNQYSTELFSFDEYSFPALEFILARYFKQFIRRIAEKGCE